MGNEHLPDSDGYMPPQSDEDDAGTIIVRRDAAKLLADVALPQGSTLHVDKDGLHVEAPEIATDPRVKLFDPNSSEVAPTPEPDREGDY